MGVLSTLRTSVVDLTKDVAVVLDPRRRPGAVNIAVENISDAIGLRLVTAARTKAADYRYGWSTARDIVQLAGSGTVLWMLMRGKRAAIPVSLGTAAAVSGLSMLSAAFDAHAPVPEWVAAVTEAGAKAAKADDDGYVVIPEEGDAPKPLMRDKVVGAVVDSLPSIAGAASLALSPKAREFLVSPFSLAPRDASLPFTPWEQVRNITMLYGVYTIVGHWAEMAFCQLIRLGLVGGDYDRGNTMLWDWWLHPFPAEGIAALCIAGGLSPLREWLLARFGGRVVPALALSFLATQAVCTSIDYLTGMVANRNYELWDYREMPFNFQGQVCLQNSLVYTTAATLITWLAYPARQNWLRSLPEDVADWTFAAFAPVYAFLCATYFL